MLSFGRAVSIGLEIDMEMPLFRISRADMNLASARAINHTLAKGRTRVLRALTDRYTVRRRALADLVRIEHARVDRDNDVIEGGIASHGGYLPMAEFKTSPSSPSVRRPKRGTRVQVLRGGGFKSIPHAFVSQMSSGHVGVFIRARAGSYYVGTRGGRGHKVIQARLGSSVDPWMPQIWGASSGSGRVSRLPIMQIFSPGPAVMTSRIATAQEPYLEEELNKRMAHEVNRLLAAAAKRRR